MNSLAAPTALPGVPATPQAQAGPGRAAGDEAFSRCLDRAVERDTAPRAAPPDRGTEAARTRGDDRQADAGQDAPDDDTLARDDDARPGPDTAQGARARGARRPGASDARGDAARPGRDVAAQAAAVATGEASAGKLAATEAGASVEAADAESRSIDTLLPGWPALPREQAVVALPGAATGSEAPAAATPMSGADVHALADASTRLGDAAAAAGRVASDADARAAVRAADPSSAQSAAQSPSQRVTHAATQRADADLAIPTAQAGRAPDPAGLPSRFADALQAAADAGPKSLASANRATPDLPSPLPPSSWAVAHAAVAATAVPEPTRVAQAQVSAPVDSPAFAPALATQVRWLVREGLQEARLSLNPAEMGPVTVQIVIDGRDARIDLRADVAATRQALEASLPVLAAALDDSGLRLAGGGVHDGASARQGQPDAGFEAPRRDQARGVDPAPAGLPAPARSGGRERGLVDLVA